MDKDAKKRWIEALRSGRYKQGQEFLMRDGRRCCLGVLCLTEGLQSRRCEEDPAAVEFRDGDGGKFESGTLPLGFRQRIGITAREQDKLVELNDQQDFTFGEIAAWVEENL